MYLFSITNIEEVSSASKRILNEQYDFIINSCKNTEDLDRSVHDIRKSSKRIRAVLRLLKPDLPPEVYRRETSFLKETSRKFATARNFHVFEEEFKNITSAGILKLSPDAENAIKQHLKEKKKEAFDLLIGLNMFTLIMRKTEEAKERINELDYSSLGPHTVYKGIGKTFAWGQKQMMHSQQFPTDENLHEMRKRIKTLMYLVRLIKDVSPDFFNGYYKGLKSASLALGDDHNMAELTDYIDAMNDELVPVEEKQKIEVYISSQRQQIQLEVWPEIAKLYTGQAAEFSKRVKAYWLLGRQG